jgi:hypothetical protein
MGCFEDFEQPIRRFRHCLRKNHRDGHHVPIRGMNMSTSQVFGNRGKHSYLQQTEEAERKPSC